MRHRTQFPIFELRPSYALIALGSALGTVLAAIAALVAGSLVSDVAAGALGTTTAAPALLGYLALSLAAQLATFGLTGWLPQRANLRREVDSSERAIDLVLHMPQRAFVRHEAGHYLNLVNMASFAHGCIVVATSTYVPGAMLSLAALLVFAALVDPTLAGVLALCALVYVPLSLLPSRAANRLQTRMMPMREAWLDEARRLVEERRAAVAAGSEGFYGRRYRERTESYRKVAPRLPAGGHALDQPAHLVWHARPGDRRCRLRAARGDGEDGRGDGHCRLAARGPARPADVLPL